MKFWVNVAVFMATAVSALTMYALGVVIAVKGTFIAVETCSHDGGGYMIFSAMFLAIGASLNVALYVMAYLLDDEIPPD